MVKSKIPIPLFQDNMKSNIDWQAWEELSRRKGAFAYAPEPLMMHRIHQESTTSGLLENNEKAGGFIGVSEVLAQTHCIAD